MELVIRSDAGRQVYGASGEASVSGPEKVDRLWARKPNPTTMICRKDRGLSSELGVLSLVGQICLPSGLNVLPQILTHPIILKPTPFALLFDRGACTQLDSVMRVIGVLSCQSLMFAMSVIGVYHAGH